jgi:hypothetical protein
VDLGGSPYVLWIGGIPVRPFRIGAAVVTINDVGGTSRHRKPRASSAAPPHLLPPGRESDGSPPQEKTTMVVSEGAPVPPAQVAADASGSQRPRSRPAGTAAGIWTAWQPSVHPRRESCTGLGATAATSTSGPPRRPPVPSTGCGSSVFPTAPANRRGPPSAAWVRSASRRRKLRPCRSTPRDQPSSPGVRSRSPMPPMGLTLPLGFVAGNSMYVAVRRSVRRRTGA